jgi:hypothetical protein
LKLCYYKTLSVQKNFSEVYIWEIPVYISEKAGDSWVFHSGTRR